MKISDIECSNTTLARALHNSNEGLSGQMQQLNEFMMEMSIHMEALENRGTKGKKGASPTATLRV